MGMVSGCRPGTGSVDCSGESDGRSRSIGSSRSVGGSSEDGIVPGLGLGGWHPPCLTMCLPLVFYWRRPWIHLW